MRKIHKNENTDVKNRILVASEELFSSKGYDATGINEIAKKASVTKSLIYYYFKNKGEILEQLFESNINDYINQKELFSNQITAININNININDINEYADKSFAALKEKAEIIKIAVIEVLKNDKKDYSLFKMMDLSFTSMAPKMKETGLKIQNETDSLITGFFFGVAPVIFSIILGEKWAEFYNIDIDEYNDKFSIKLKEFYLKYASEFLIENKK